MEIFELIGLLFTIACVSLAIRIYRKNRAIKATEYKRRITEYERAQAEY